MRNISGKEFCKILEKNGWILKRITGSHHVFMKSGEITRLSVPVHGNKPLKIGLLNALIKTAKIKELCS